MAINFNQAFAAQPIRTPAAGDTLANQRGSPPKAEAAPVAEAESSAEARKAAEPTEGVPEGGLSAALAREAEQVDLTRAVEQANALAESALRATNRSIMFEKDDTSGRVKITIREEVNGEEVTRQIPPSQFLKVVERLRQLNTDGAEPPRGTLISVDG